VELLPVHVNLLESVLNTTDWIFLDDLDIRLTQYHPSPDLLKISSHQVKLTSPTVFVSHLFRSNCPVTQQPDWASMYIEYQGYPLGKEGLLAYLCSYREHNGFHESCVEQVFMDIWQRCQPELLSVYGRYTRRGGIDINPWRSSYLKQPVSILQNTRWVRQ
jgi:7-cyano-7-deazaguanine reductase